MENKGVNTQEINGEATGIYIHIPFCRKKCIYCDFFSGGGKGTDWPRFIRALANELSFRREELKGYPCTLYIGGGTPSMMPPEAFRTLVAEVGRLTGKTDNWEEFTIEVNPEDVTEENCRVWKECGVNRVSMGVQTLNDDELRLIGRNHDSETALKGMGILRRNFNNYTVDLIFGLPGQTLESWIRTVDTVVAKRPDHISAYSLMFEEGTAMTLLRNQGRLSFPAEEECVEMWGVLQDKLKGAGYERYEISNYALPGKESVHNRRYWLGNPYIGIGPSAHSYDGCRLRRANRNDIKGYMESFSPHGLSEIAGNHSTFYKEENLLEEELIEERIMLSMRMAQGLDLEAFRESFGEKALGTLMRNAVRPLKEGSLVKEEGFLRLGENGWMIADDIILQLCL